MATVDNVYHELAHEIIDKGYWYLDESRGVKCLQISSYNLVIPNIYKEFPLITTKKMFTKGIVGELIWFLRGLDNLEYLHENNIHIWDKDAKNNKFFGKLSDTHVGRNYGVQWREWKHAPEKYTRTIDGNEIEFTETEYVDQIANLIGNLVQKPMGRRHIVTAWNPAELDETALPPCHWAFEIIPRPLGEHERMKLYEDIYGDRSLDDFAPKGGVEVQSLMHQIDTRLYNAGIPSYAFDLKWHQRSVDTFLGLPFNIASYGLLMRIIAEFTGYLPDNLIGDLSNVHFYEPHTKAIKEQLENEPEQFEACKLSFSSTLETMFHDYRKGNITSHGEFMSNIFNSIEISDITFENYYSFPKIEAEMFEPKQ